MAPPILAAMRFVLATFAGGGTGLTFATRRLGGMSAAPTGGFYAGGHVVITTHCLDGLLAGFALRIRDTARGLVGLTRGAERAGLHVRRRGFLGHDLLLSGGRCFSKHTTTLPICLRPKEPAVYFFSGRVACGLRFFYSRKPATPHSNAIKHAPPRVPRYIFASSVRNYPFHAKQTVPPYLLVAFLLTARGQTQVGPCVIQSIHVYMIHCLRWPLACV
jgi:hypothetical protein